MGTRLDLLPRGIWAIGSDLENPEDAATFAQGASRAAACTYRRGGGNPRQRLAALQLLRDRVPFLAVHGNGDLALAAGADAVITGVRSLPLEAYARRFPTLLRGASTHDLDEVRRGLDQGAEFLLFGPVWETPEKRGILEPRGLPALQEACALGAPVLAIGGIGTPQQVRACLEAGAYGVAVLRAAREAQVLAELVTAAASALDA